MPSLYSPAGKNRMLDHLVDTGGAVWASLHTGDPGTTGTNEVTTAGAVYARQSISWGSAAAGAVSSSNQQEFDVPASTTITDMGLWSAQTEGTFYGHGPLSSQEVFGDQGTYTLTSIDLDLNNDEE